MQLRVVLLTSDDPQDDYLAAEVSRRARVLHWFVEPGRERLKKLLRRRRWASLFWSHYHQLRKRLLGIGRRRRRFFAVAADDRKRLAELPRIVVPSANDGVVERFLREHEPDLVIIRGIGILAPRILRAAPGRFVNVHGGYLPDYRGNHCIFFALCHGDHGHIGGTVHFVDEGVDTGAIVRVVPQTPDSSGSDAPDVVYSHSVRGAINALAELLEKDPGTWPRHPQPAGGRTFRTADRTIVHDVGYWLRRTWRRRLR